MDQHCNLPQESQKKYDYSAFSQLRRLGPNCLNLQVLLVSLFLHSIHAKSSMFICM